MRARLAALENENRELQRQRDPTEGQRVFRGSGDRSPHDVTHTILDAFIDAHRGADGVEPICRVLVIAPSAYDVCRQRQADATRRAPRAQRDAILQPNIVRVSDRLKFPTE